MSLQSEKDIQIVTKFFNWLDVISYRSSCLQRHLRRHLGSFMPPGSLVIKD